MRRVHLGWGSSHTDLSHSPLSAERALVSITGLLKIPAGKLERRPQCLAMTLRMHTSLAARSLKTPSIHSASSGGRKLGLPPLCQACVAFHRRELPSGRGQGTWNCTVFNSPHSSREWVMAISCGEGLRPVLSVLCN